jgi:hypothetical protein
MCSSVRFTEIIAASLTSFSALACRIHGPLSTFARLQAVLINDLDQSPLFDNLV